MVTALLNLMPKRLRLIFLALLFFTALFTLFGQQRREDSHAPQFFQYGVALSGGAPNSS